MKIIGLTGGSGAGKSMASTYFHDLGAGIVNADKIYFELCENNRNMLDDIKNEFGNVLTDKGKLNRKKLSQIVFGGLEKLEKLNLITFPYIKEQSKKNFELMKQKDIIIYDAPTLFQTGANNFCDKTIAVIAQRQKRIERITKRDEITVERAILRIDAQPSDEFYFENCTYIIENNCSHENLKKQVENVWNKLIE